VPGLSLLVLGKARKFRVRVNKNGDGNIMIKKSTLGKALLAVTLAAGLSIGGAMAQSNSLSKQIISDAGKPIANFDIQNIYPILQEMGISYEGRADDEGNKLLIAQASSGLKFAVVPAACLNGANSGCVGMNVIALFPEAPQRDVNSFNYRYAFTSAGINPANNASYISRYVIADYGIPKGNIASNLYNFIAQAEMFQKVIGGARKTVALEADPNDLAAHSLNMQAVMANEAASQILGHTMGHHQVSLEETPAMIDMLVRADKADPGKIINFTVKK
jgi:putative sensory transduction regulator